MKRTAKNVSKVIGASLVLFGTVTAWSAVEYAKVVSRTPVLEQVLVPREACRNEATTVQPPKSGAGALVGAIAGGVLGHQVGDGSGRVIATTVGAVGGAVIGNRLEPAPATRVITTQRCVTEQVIENRIAAYDVVYEWGGKQYRTQLDYDPGESLALEISPLRSATVPPAADCREYNRRFDRLSDNHRVPQRARVSGRPLRVPERGRELRVRAARSGVRQTISRSRWARIWWARWRRA
jgi:uncharacterized protein YcfJ